MIHKRLHKKQKTEQREFHYKSALDCTQLLLMGKQFPFL